MRELASSTEGSMKQGNDTTIQEEEAKANRVSYSWQQLQNYLSHGVYQI
jgi:hypothetical protein